MARQLLHHGSPYLTRTYVHDEISAVVALDTNHASAVLCATHRAVLTVNYRIHELLVSSRAPNPLSNVVVAPFIELCARAICSGRHAAMLGQIPSTNYNISRQNKKPMYDDKVDQFTDISIRPSLRESLRKDNICSLFCAGVALPPPRVCERSRTTVIQFSDTCISRAGETCVRKIEL
jgi:hypothetical protein